MQRLSESDQLPAPPFEVVSVHDGHNLMVIDVDEDPLDVGVVCVYFKEGGWLMVSDLLKHFKIVRKGR